MSPTSQLIERLESPVCDLEHMASLAADVIEALADEIKAGDIGSARETSEKALFAIYETLRRAKAMKAGVYAVLEGESATPAPATPSEAAAAA